MCLYLNGAAVCIILMESSVFTAKGAVLCLYFN